MGEKAGMSGIKVSAAEAKTAPIELESEHPNLEDKIFKDPDQDELSESVTVIKDEKNITYLQGLETELNDGDRSSLFTRDINSLYKGYLDGKK